MAAGPSHDSISEAWNSKNARRSGAIVASPSHDSGMSIIIACGSGRPACTKSSSALSSDAESLWPASMSGKSSSMFGRRGDDIRSSATPIQRKLPLSVLISPLWQRKRYGCARDQDGKVFVEKREWTSANPVATFGSTRSG